MKQALEQASKASKFVSLFLDISDSSLLSLCTRFSILAMHHLDHGEYHVADLLTWGVVWYKKISGPFYFDHHHVIHFEDFPHDYTKTKNLLLSSQILHYPNPKQSCPYNILVLPCLLWQDIISLVQPPLSIIPTDLPCLALPIPLIQSSPSPFLELQQTYHNRNKQKAQTDTSTFKPFSSSPPITQLQHDPPTKMLSFHEAKGLYTDPSSQGSQISSQNKKHLLSSPLLKSRGLLSNRQRAIERCLPRNRSPKNS